MYAKGIGNEVGAFLLLLLSLDPVQRRNGEEEDAHRAVKVGTWEELEEDGESGWRCYLHIHFLLSVGCY